MEDINHSAITPDFKSTVGDELFAKEIVMATLAGRDYIFKRCSEEIGIRETGMTDDEYVIVDGLATSMSTWKMPSYDSPADVWERAEMMGFFQDNNGTITWVDEKGRICVIPSTQKVYDILMKAGYVPGTTLDVVSNGQTFRDPSVQEKWIRLKKDAEVQRQVEASLKQTQGEIGAAVDYQI